MRRKKPRRRNGSPKKKNTLHVVVGLAPRRPSVLEQKAKAALIRFLETAERDPERVISGIQKLGDTVDSAYRFIQENPKKAKATAGKLGLAMLAGLARKSLTEKR